MEVINQLVGQYGFIIIFALLSLGGISILISDELLVFGVGYFTKIGTLDYTTALIVCFFGTFIGMMVNYCIGRKAGRPFILKIGKWAGFTEKRITRTEKWMSRYGQYSIIISYFIPGIRHITGYFCGVLHIKFKTYAFYAGVSTVIWCSLFLILGRLFGVN
ncbi:MAG: DedA family protein [Solibacillus sp.]|jgi:membrane protein DedA with SNARE-associated domain|uniref:DedA family protein n=1 Tax=unclassified Solibacillus TaxID=2637870 RepID=UPI0030FA2D96